MWPVTKKLPLPMGNLLVALAWVIVLWAGFHGGLTFLSRFLHPFQLEWSEGSTFLQGLEFARTGRLFGDPTESLFIPHLYTPGHSILLGGLLKIFPPTLALGRVLSLVATLGTALLLCRIARQAGAGRFWSTLAGLSLVGLAPAVGYWYDLVRVDMLFALLFTGSIVCLFKGGEGNLWALAFSALLLVGSALVKQTALAYGPVFFLVLVFLSSFRLALIWGLLTGLALAVLFGLMQLMSGGWFWYYTFTVLGRHPGIETGAKWGDLLASLLPLWPLVILPFLATPWRGDRSTSQGRCRLALVTLCLWGLPFAVYSFMKHGGFVNAWIPLFITSLPLLAGASGWFRRNLCLTALALSLLTPLLPSLNAALSGSFRNMLYNTTQLPLEGDAKAQEDVVKSLEEAGPSIWCPNNVWITFKADDRILPLLHLVGELMVKDFLPDPLVDKIRNREFKAILFCGNTIIPGLEKLTTLDTIGADPRYKRLHELILRNYDPTKAKRIHWPDRGLGYQRLGPLFRPALLVPRREVK